MFNTPFSLGPWVLPPNSLTFHYPQNTDPPLPHTHRYLSNPLHFPQRKTYWNGTLHLYLQLLFFFSLLPMRLSPDLTYLKVLSHLYTRKYLPCYPPFIFFFSSPKHGYLSSKLVTILKTLVLAPSVLLILSLNLTDQISLLFYHFIPYKITKFHYLDGSPIWRLPSFYIFSTIFSLSF